MEAIPFTDRFRKKVFGTFPYQNLVGYPVPDMMYMDADTMTDMVVDKVSNVW